MIQKGNYNKFVMVKISYDELNVVKFKPNSKNIILRTEVITRPTAQEERLTSTKEAFLEFLGNYLLSFV